MRGMRVPCKVTRSTKLRGAQHSPKLGLESTDFCVPANFSSPVSRCLTWGYFR